MLKFYMFFSRVKFKPFFSPALMGFLLSGMVALLTGCSDTYPDNDPFRNTYPGILDHYYFTNVSYRIEESAPVIEGSTVNNRLFFLIDQRDDIYYNKGFSVNFKKFDRRWFLQIDDVSTNYIFFSNTGFGNKVSFHYYELGGDSPVVFTNGYLMVTQAGPLNWYVKMEVEKGEISRSAAAFHRLAVYSNEDFSLIE